MNEMTTKKKPAKPTKTGSQDRAKIADMVLEGMRGGLSCFKACAVAGVHSSTFNDWINADAALAVKYAGARETLIEKMAEDILEIADTPVGSTDSGATDSGAVQKQRLQVDTRKWLLSKLAPKKYGEKVVTEHTGPGGGPVQIAALDLKNLSDVELAQMQELLSRAGTGGAV